MDTICKSTNHISIDCIHKLLEFLKKNNHHVNLGSLITIFYQVCNHLKFVQLDVTMMQLDVTKCDYNAT
jgi:hypothetical protein